VANLLHFFPLQDLTNHDPLSLGANAASSELLHRALKQPTFIVNTELVVHITHDGEMNHVHASVDDLQLFIVTCR
jgi:hypothetical protein